MELGCRALSRYQDREGGAPGQTGSDNLLIKSPNCDRPPLSKSKPVILLMELYIVRIQKTVCARANGFQIGFHAVTLTREAPTGIFSCGTSARNDM